MAYQFKLDHGFTIGSGSDAETYFDVTLCEVTTAILLDARTESENIECLMQQGRPKYVKVLSEELFAINLLRRQIVKIGSINGPFSLSDLKKLHIDDFSMIAAKANGVEDASLEELVERGRMDSAG